MQSTEKESRTQKDLASRLNAEAEWMLVDPSDWMKSQADLLNEAATALAAERDRADRAEAALAEIREYADDASEDVPAAGIDSILDKWEATA